MGDTKILFLKDRFLMVIDEKSLLMGHCPVRLGRNTEPAISDVLSEATQGEN